MELTAVEWIVSIFALIGLIKIAFVITYRKGWIPVVTTIYGNARLFSVLFAIIAAIMLYFLLQEMTIIQILAVMSFTALFMGLFFLSIASEMKQLSLRLLQRKLNGWMWVYLLIWAGAFLWALWNIFYT